MTYARQCTACGAGMNEGYVIDGGRSYYCSDGCLHVHISPQEYEELYADGMSDSFWTEWEEDEDE